MSDEKDFIDRRKHSRYKVRDGAFAALISGSNAKLGLISDICQDGLAFRYVVDDSDQLGCAEGNCTMDILFDAEGYFLESLPCTTVWEMPLRSEDSFSHLAIKKCSVHFGSLTPEQKSKLSYFIDHYAKKPSPLSA